MDFNQLAQQLQIWNGGIYTALQPYLAQARAEGCRVQSTAGGDEEIASIEQMATAQAEPVFLQRERDLEKMQAIADRLLGAMEDPPEVATALRDSMGEAGSKAREWYGKKLASIVAQAYAGELLPEPPRR